MSHEGSQNSKYRSNTFKMSKKMQIFHNTRSNSNMTNSEKYAECIIDEHSVVENNENIQIPVFPKI